MTKKTGIIIAFLLLVTVALIMVAATPHKSTAPDTKMAMTLTPTPAAHTTLSLSPSILLLPTSPNKIQVLINTNDNKATAIQLEVSYDPKALSDVVVEKADFFTNPLILLNNTQKATGKITYAFGIAPNNPGKAGMGPVATITFKSLMKSGEKTKIELLPNTLVTASGEKQSVLKQTQFMTTQIEQK